MKVSNNAGLHQQGKVVNWCEWRSWCAASSAPEVHLECKWLAEAYAFLCTSFMRVCLVAGTRAHGVLAFYLLCVKSHRWKARFAKLVNVMICGELLMGECQAPH